MPGIKISDLPQDSAPQAADLLVTVDVSDATDDPAGSNKRVRIQDLPPVAINKVTGLQAALDGLAGGGSVTLTGHVTGTGTGTISTTIGAGVVTASMLAGSIPASKLVGSDLTIAESQVTGLASDLTTIGTSLAAKAADNAVVHLTGPETIAGAKTFSSTIVGSISGNAATVTSGVYTTGTYADPTWLTSVAGSKVTGNIAGNAAGLTANILESQVTGLPADLAARLTTTNNLSDVASAATARSNLGVALALTWTTVKTANYSGAAGECVPVDTTSGAVTVTLPTAPPNKTPFAVKHIIQGASNAVTYQCSGSDVFNRAGGPTTGTLPLVNQGVVLVYDSARSVWGIVADDITLSSLDARFATAAQGALAATAIQPAALSSYATLASPTFTGTVTLPVGLTGLAKLTSGVVSAATAGTDYLAPAGNGSGLTSLNASNISSGTLAVARGGTGLSTIGISRIPYASATDTISTSSNLSFDGSTLTVSNNVAATNAFVVGSNVNLGQAGNCVLGPSGQYLFRATSGGSTDTGLARSAAGVVSVTNASTGAGGLSSPANTPTTLAASTNNYSPGVGLFQRWSASTPVNVTGMVAGQAGEIRYLWNVGSSTITLTNQDASSTAANRWLTSTGADLALAAGKCALAMEDTTTAAWRVTLLP